MSESHANKERRERAKRGEMKAKRARQCERVHPLWHELFANLDLQDTFISPPDSLFFSYTGKPTLLYSFPRIEAQALTPAESLVVHLFLR